MNALLITMSTPKRDAQQLMHWCKNGDMVLKNKVKDTILRENVHEERFLDSTLKSLNKHQNQKQRQLVNKRLQFAKRRQRSLDKSEFGFRLLERHRSYSDGALNVEEDQNSHKKSFNPKLKWKKAISVVRIVVQTKSGNRKTQIKGRAGSFLPNLAATPKGSGPKSSPRISHGNVDDNHLVLPRITSATDNNNCLEDPRFLRLQQILSLHEEKVEDADRGYIARKKQQDRQENHERLRSQTFHL